MIIAAVALAGCNAGGADGSSTDGTDTDTAGTTETQGTTETDGETGEPPQLDTNGFANGCYVVRSGDGFLAADASGQGYAFDPSEDAAAKFFMKASDLGTYLLYDTGGGYLVADDGPLLRQTSLQSDVLLTDDTYVSGAEWMPETSLVDWDQYQLRNRRNDQLLGETGLADEGAPLTFEPATGCVEHPELSLDASGTVQRTTFDNGDLYGIVDTHSHILSNFGFGGGGIFHGGAFHRLGVEHALPDCELYHGENGRKDFFGYAFDTAGADGADLAGLIPDLIAGELADDNHMTAGYPEFTDWPHAPTRSTHQTQYYRWLERAHLAGLRLVVQHATTNSVICNFTAGQDLQQTRYECDDMVAVDRIIDETYVMERYIDAQSGGPGMGWFRVVQTPAEAREVIAAGKMAVILGIETSDLFDCALTPKAGDPTCDEAYIQEQLDYYYSLGVRAMFPVHKYDNAFSPGDGDRAFIELGNFLNSGHWSNFTLDCPAEVTDGFDKGDVNFGGLNQPREEYNSAPPNNLSAFPDMPLNITSVYLQQILEPPLVGAYCQNASLTPLGETLISEMMARGMIIEVDHFSQQAYKRVFELLEAANYPAAGTHGRNFNGRLYELGGVSKTGFGRCREAGNPGSTVQGFLNKIQQITDVGGYPAEGFGFDLNGFAGARGPRFGDGVCADEQMDPITYPFSSYAGDIEFTQPVIGNRELDFNTEGLVHIGLLPELIEDARRDAVSEDDLDPLFRSAEGYIRMWELSEQRAAALRANVLGG
ncbi:Peptidase, M19 family protein [Enhygromyxa salina]|uniref:Peptidase, M19 family protein n=1 Tax=Enhygromyxa salina TaxID=215803 RepID=A0A0C2DD86_9BACT|nr:Peptidase, M19 family protein [Enhygromyxa salina]